MKRIKCNICSHQTDTFKRLRLHQTTVHTDCKVGYACFFCDRLLKSPYDHREHLIRKHGDHCDLTTPPPTARLDPRKAAKTPAKFVPPPEARLNPNPAKRFKPAKETTLPSTPVDIMAELEAILQGDLSISDDEQVKSPPRPLDNPYKYAEMISRQPHVKSRLQPLQLITILRHLNQLTL